MTLGNIMIVDVETGGKKPSEHPITQLAYQIVDPITFRVLDKWDSYVKPYADLTIDQAALTYTRVSMKKIQEGIEYTQLLGKLIEVFKNFKQGKTPLVLAGHNIGFDIRFIKWLFEYKNKDLYSFVSINTIDTMFMTAWGEEGLFKSDESSRLTLTACCERQGIIIKSAHGAPADVEATKKLLHKIVTKMRLNFKTTTDDTSDVQTKSREKFKFEF